jgi:hypothetical protein
VSAEHLNQDQFSKIGKFWVDNDTGQGSMLHPNAGTGLHNDPDNGKHRRNLISSMMNGVEEQRHKKVASTLNRSNVPLQHLGDVASTGLVITSHNYGKGSTLGAYEPSEGREGRPDVIFINHGEENNVHAITHEVGHAVHDYQSRKFSSDGKGVSSDADLPTREGVADGYADYYSGTKKTVEETGYGRAMLMLTGLGGYRDYLHNRAGVSEGGKVPHNASARTADDPSVKHGAALDRWADAADARRKRTQEERLF